MAFMMGGAVKWVIIFVKWAKFYIYLSGGLICLLKYLGGKLLKVLVWVFIFAIKITKNRMIFKKPCVDVYDINKGFDTKIKI